MFAIERTDVINVNGCKSNGNRLRDEHLLLAIESEVIISLISYETKYSLDSNKVVVLQTNTYCNINQINIVRPYILHTSGYSRLPHISS